MKFFTLDWWKGCQNSQQTIDKVKAPHQAYKEHYTAIQSLLPTNVQQFYDKENLHDATLITVDYQTTEKKLQLVLNVDDGSYTIWYTDVTYLGFLADPTKGFPSPRGFGDLGYDEFDITDNQILEHRMLFSSGIELSIQCRTFEYEKHET